MMSASTPIMSNRAEVETNSPALSADDQSIEVIHDEEQELKTDSSSNTLLKMLSTQLSTIDVKFDSKFATLEERMNDLVNFVKGSTPEKLDNCKMCKAGDKMDFNHTKMHYLFCWTCQQLRDECSCGRFKDGLDLLKKQKN
jgi:hypothetical protein